MTRSATTSDVDDGKIGASRLQEVRDGSTITRHHHRGADHGCDCPVNDVGGARLGEDPTDSVCGVLVQAVDVASAQQQGVDVPDLDFSSGAGPGAIGGLFGRGLNNDDSKVQAAREECRGAFANVLPGAGSG